MQLKVKPDVFVDVRRTKNISKLPYRLRVWRMKIYSLYLARRLRFTRKHKKGKSFVGVNGPTIKTNRVMMKKMLSQSNKINKWIITISQVAAMKAAMKTIAVNRSVITLSPKVVERTMAILRTKLIHKKRVKSEMKRKTNSSIFFMTFQIKQAATIN